MVADDSVVIWNPQNQQEILTTHFGFTMRSNFPTTLEVLYAQEDYWVLDNIMQIIRATNKITNSKGELEDAQARHDAVVKYIDFVRIGRSAYGLAGKVYPVGRSATSTEGGMVPGTEGAGGAPSSAGGSSDGSGAGESPSSAARSGSSSSGGASSGGGGGESPKSAANSGSRLAVTM